MKQHHSDVLHGHWGVRKIRKTYDLVARKFFFKRMKPLIGEFARTCPICQRIKPDRRPTQGLLLPLQFPTRKWQSIAIDWVLGLPETWRKGVAYDSILTVVDRATKMVDLLSTQKNCSAVDTSELLLLNVFKYGGLPSRIISNCDPKLAAQWWLEFCNVLQIDHHFTTAYRKLDGYPATH